MAMLDALKESNDIKEDGDSIGFSVLDSDIYTIKIKLAYITLAQSKAMALNIHGVTSDNKEIKQVFYMTSGEAKGCKNHYINKKTGEKHYLPGFNQANHLCLLTIGKKIGQIDTQKKTINLYDPAMKKEVPTEVDMIMEMIDKEVIAGLLSQVEDKRALNANTGKYEPTGETRKTNEVDKFFRKRDSMTVMEIKTKAEEPVFISKWLAKWKGQVKDKTTGAGDIKTGSPRKTGKQAETTDLFT